MREMIYRGQAGSWSLILTLIDLIEGWMGIGKIQLGSGRVMNVSCPTVTRRQGLIVSPFGKKNRVERGEQTGKVDTGGRGIHGREGEPRRCLCDRLRDKRHDLVVQELLQLLSADVVLVYWRGGIHSVYETRRERETKWPNSRSNSKNSGSRGGATGSSSGSCCGRHYYYFIKNDGGIRRVVTLRMPRDTDGQGRPRL